MQLTFKRILVLFVLVAPLAMVGCANSDPTAYQAASSVGEEGFSHTKLSKNKYRVVFNGNRFTNKVLVRDYALLHAAELTLQQGYDWFIVTDSTSETEQRHVIRETHTPVTTSRIDQRCGLVSCTTTVYPQANHIEVTRQQKNGNMISTLVISMGKRNLPSEQAYNAKEVATTIRSQ